MTVEDHLVNPEALRSLYEHPLDWSQVRIRSINLNWRGPTVALRVDLPAFPVSPPVEWIEAGVDTVQCQLQFLAVEGISLTEWTTPAVGSLDVAPWGTERRMRVTFRGRGAAVQFDCNESVRIGHVSAFESHPDGSDDVPHLFVSKVDARRFSALPATHEKTFYAR
ncbi:Imm50 family immunity protein [Streptomyces sp. NPDC005574]|uniref:Imm50 family immunity protein n=1 Tax=Streptomyces sp. NPDC005574 TaxID=3156891 RepID=UPI0033A0A267